MAKAGQGEDKDVWVSEAIVSFLKGPMYVHPLMTFIDEQCLIFTVRPLVASNVVRTPHVCSRQACAPLSAVLRQPQQIHALLCAPKEPCLTHASWRAYHNGMSTCTCPLSIPWPRPRLSPALCRHTTAHTDAQPRLLCVHAARG